MHLHQFVNYDKPKWHPYMHIHIPHCLLGILLSDHRGWFLSWHWSADSVGDSGGGSSEYACANTHLQIIVGGHWAVFQSEKVYSWATPGGQWVGSDVKERVGKRDWSVDMLWLLEQTATGQSTSINNMSHVIQTTKETFLRDTCYSNLGLGFPCRCRLLCWSFSSFSSNRLDWWTLANHFYSVRSSVSMSILLHRWNRTQTLNLSS